VNLPSRPERERRIAGKVRAHVGQRTFGPQDRRRSSSRVVLDRRVVDDELLPGELRIHRNGAALALRAAGRIAIVDKERVLRIDGASRQAVRRFRIRERHVGERYAVVGGRRPTRTPGGIRLGDVEDPGRAAAVDREVELAGSGDRHRARDIDRSCHGQCAGDADHDRDSRVGRRVALRDRVGKAPRTAFVQIDDGEGPGGGTRRGECEDTQYQQTLMASP
jgi:hypothetical protein